MPGCGGVFTCIGIDKVLSEFCTSFESNVINWPLVRVQLDCSQSLFYFVPQESHSHAGSASPLWITTLYHPQLRMPIGNMEDNH